MLFTEYKKRLKQNLSEIEIVSEDEEENNFSESSIEQKMDTNKLFVEDNERVAEMSRTLMAYIGEAIEKWSQQYDMQKLPRNIVFKKALTLMNAWDKTEIFQ